MCVTLLPCSHCRAYRHGLIWMDTLFCQTARHLDMVFMAPVWLETFTKNRIDIDYWKFKFITGRQAAVH